MGGHHAGLLSLLSSSSICLVPGQVLRSGYSGPTSLAQVSRNEPTCGRISLLVQPEDPAPDSFVDRRNLHVVSYMQLDAGSRDSDMSYRPREECPGGTCHPLINADGEGSWYC